ncbi:heme-binding protein [Candidatus Bathyarchaeota archaeon]|nr:heme-binding protein [Candidatus Bathyarchaeota archaeon]
MLYIDKSDLFGNSEVNVLVETASYETIIDEGKFEIRLYDKIIVASVENISGSPFRVLFQYINGANSKNTEIDMTSPVITSEKIAMTSPVINEKESMSFVLPSKYSMDNVPQPIDERVSIREIPERYIATVRFGGLAWKDQVKDQTERLLKWLQGKNIVRRSNPFLMQYNPPYVPGFLRRNEVGVEIEYKPE